MTQVTLPRTNQTGTNEWEDVEANDRALRDVINGNLDNDNIKAAANIAGSKLADASIPYAKLKPYTASAPGDQFTLSTSDQVYAKIENVPPGLYQVTGTIFLGSVSDVAAVDAEITTSGGSATLTPSGEEGPRVARIIPAGRVSAEVSVGAALQVTTQTTVQLLVSKTSSGGGGVASPSSDEGGLLIFGFRS